MSIDHETSTTQIPAQATAAPEPAPLDMDALMAFVGRFVGDLGATISAGNVMVGERLGLYRALAQGPADARTLAERTGTDPRYVEEWLRGQAAGGYVEYDAARATYSMTPEQAFALTDPDGPGVPARRVRARARCAEGRAPHRGGVPHRGRASGGTSTTTTCSAAASGSSGPATSCTC